MRVGMALGLLFIFTHRDLGRGEGLPAEYVPCIEKGLEWLAKAQRRDGHWRSNERYPVSMTALSGLALLMEGSTLRSGKYSTHLSKAVDWLLSQSRPNGLIAALGRGEEGSYMYGHGFAMLFLASVYGEETRVELRSRLEKALTDAVLFSGQAQDAYGQWSYVSAKDAAGGGVDSSSTVTQMQGLRAARNAGIVVPTEIIIKGLKCLRESTSRDGGVCYSRSQGLGGEQGRPAITAAAIASCFAAGEYRSGLVKKWMRFTQKHFPVGSTDRRGHDEYVHFYLSQVMYCLGEDGYGKLFPESQPEEQWTWRKYRTWIFERLKRTQSSEGNWKDNNWGIGDVYVTAMHLAIFQLDVAALPVFQR